MYRSRSEEYSDKRNLQTRTFQAPVCRVTHAYGRSVEFNGAVCWKTLPPHRRKAESYEIFKKAGQIKLKALRT